MYKNNIFFIFKKLFLTLAHQNDQKNKKNNNLKLKYSNKIQKIH
jgi:hypothetical protein